MRDHDDDEGEYTGPAKVVRAVLVRSIPNLGAERTTPLRPIIDFAASDEATRRSARVLFRGPRAGRNYIEVIDAETGEVLETHDDVPHVSESDWMMRRDEVRAAWASLRKRWPNHPKRGAAYV